MATSTAKPAMVTCTVHRCAFPDGAQEAHRTGALGEANGGTCAFEYPAGYAPRHNHPIRSRADFRPLTGTVGNRPSTGCPGCDHANRRNVMTSAFFAAKRSGYTPGIDAEWSDQTESWRG